MSDAIISVEELSKSFGKHEVLRKIDFNVAPGRSSVSLVPPVPENPLCFAVSISWRPRPAERSGIMEKRSEQSRKRSMNIAPR